MKRKLKILVLYTLPSKELPRKTTIDHLYGFKRYADHVDFHYCNFIHKMPFYLSLVKYDGIILHYTLLSYKWTELSRKQIIKGLNSLREHQAIKIAFPQDEFIYSNFICTLFQKCKIDSVFTCAYPVDYQKLYPKEKTGLKYYFTTLTGYVDELTVSHINRLSTLPQQRHIDVGYRARKLPYWLGKFGQIKGEIADVLLNHNSLSDLKMDISTDPKDVFYGDEWIKFLLRCRTMIGCLGGSSMHDPDGKIREMVETFVIRNKTASFEEVERHCFLGKDNTLQLFALSPRHFECAMARTCQVLVEGNYGGVFKAGVHYIELKKDYSNLSDVLNQIADGKKCKQIADQAYKDIVESGKYSYRVFANGVVKHIAKVSQERGLQTNCKFNNWTFETVNILLKIRKKIEFIHWFLFRIYLFLTIRIPKKLKTKLTHWIK